jgi:hypothetical protein
MLVASVLLHSEPAPTFVDCGFDEAPHSPAADLVE